MSIIQAQQKAAEALNSLVSQAYQDGFDTALHVAEEILNHCLAEELQVHGPTGEIKIRQWGERLIRKARQGGENSRGHKTNL